MIKQRKGDAFFLPSHVLWRRNGISEEEGAKIKNAFKKTGVFWVNKDSSKIYFVTWSMLDISHGVYLFYHGDEPDHRYKKIFDDWYY